MVFAALGGVGVAQSAISAAQYQYGKKVTICHKGKTITVSKHAARAHLRHHDTLGACGDAKKRKHKHHKTQEHADQNEHAKAKDGDDEKSQSGKTEKPGHGNEKGHGRGK